MKLFFIILLTAIFVFSCGEDGAAGAAGTDGALIKLTQEAENTENCDGNGGTKVETGTDVNSDGILDEGEITSTSFICNGDLGEEGTTGSTGTDGSSSLVNITDEPTGTENCEGKGGKRIEAGTDANNDGTLQEEEVDAISFVCNDKDNVYYGDLSINFKSELDALSAYDTVVGNISFGLDILDIETDEFLTEISFPNLKVVTGSISAGLFMFGKTKGKIEESSLITKISFPLLERAGSLYINYISSLTSLELPKFKEVLASDWITKGFFGGGLSIRGNNSLVTLDLSSLNRGYIAIENNDLLESIDLSGMTNDLTSSIYIEDNSVLSSIDLSNIEQVYALYFEGLSSMTALPALPKLNKIDRFYVSSNDVLTKIELPELTSIGTEYGELYINENTLLEEISFPKLESFEGDFNIDSNENLKTIEMPVLEGDGIDDIDITDNTNLSECDLYNFLKGLSTSKYNMTITNNKPCNYYEFNPEGEKDILKNDSFLEFMNSSSWSLAEKFIIPDTSTTDFYSHIYRGIKNNNLAGNFKVIADPSTNTVTSTIYDGTDWVTVSVTDSSVVKKEIISVILNYDATTTTLTLYVNGKTDATTGTKTVTPIDDSAGSNTVYIASKYVSGEEGGYVDHTPYGSMHLLFSQRILTNAEITDYSDALENILPITDNTVNYSVNFIDGDTTLSAGFSIIGSPTSHSILNLLGI